ncbi:hypothetical protein V5799_032046 [Amblyomma americanum]|uniref:GH18 domain-containing protein n=1 Tax=Amblyomma americanum TaxID=6943 RepID=A0AAQ4DSA6_AMBAM
MDQRAPGPRVPPGILQAGSEAPRQERARSPRWRTGFPGIGPLEVSPNVILFVPRRTPLGTPGANLAHPVQEVSPDRAAAQRAGETPEDERLCLRTWALCIATMGPFILSSWMFALPFLIRTNMTSMLPPLPVPAPPVTGPPATSANTPGISSATSATDATTTGKSSTVIPPSCFDSSPNITDVSGPLQVPGRFRPLNKLIEKKPFFCLFNNSRYRNPMRRHFAFETLPFELCPYVVYWSMSVVNGTITSRVPRFDQLYGLERMRAIVSNRGFPTTRILLALGGYQQDAPHFSMLGADRRLMEKFLRSVANTTIRYRLDGVTMHWVPARPGCEGPNDVQTLEDILRELRTWYNASGLPPIIISVILPARNTHVDFAVRVAKVVDFFFLDTRAFTPTTKFLRTLCSSVTSAVQTAVVTFVRRSGGVLQKRQVCMMDSLAPLSSTAKRNPLTGLYELDVMSPSELKRTRFYDACRAYHFCRENRTDSCVVHRSLSLMSMRRATLYIVNSAITWMERSSYEYLYGKSPDKNACVLIADLDYDDYGNWCGARYEQYILLMNFYFGSYGATGRGIPIHSVAPPC